MKRYMNRKRILYFAMDKKASVHIVPKVNWELYLKKRLNVPIFCKIFDTVEGARIGALEEGENERIRNQLR